MKVTILKILKFLSIWIGINFCIAVFITALKYRVTVPNTILSQFLIAFIITNAIALPSEFIGSLVGKELIHKPFVRVFGITILVSLVASFLSMVPASFLLYYFADPSYQKEPIYYITNIFIPGLFLTIVIASFSTFIMHLFYQLRELNTSAPDKETETNSIIPAKFLTVKEDENHVVIPLEAILYISAGKDNCIIHTLERDHKITRHMKQVEQMLPVDRFLRVHKSYLLNLDWVSHIQYLAGGRYVAFLKDKDETEVLIGKTYAGELKRHLGM